jgi:hypothetical protein
MEEVGRVSDAHFPSDCPKMGAQSLKSTHGSGLDQYLARG